MQYMNDISKTLFITDLDGTLLNSNGVVSEQSTHIINELIARHGLNFAIATARSPATAMPLLGDIDLRLPSVVLAGAALWDAQLETYTHTWPIDESIITEICQIYERHGAHPFIYRQSGAQLQAHHLSCISPREAEFMKSRTSTHYKDFILDDKPYEPSPCPALIVFSTDRYTVMEEIYHDIAARGIDCHPICYCDIYAPGYGYLEIYGSHVSKAAAIATLADEYGFEQIVAFGDNANDMEMMEMADYSVAPSNALVKVKRIASEVVGCNDDDCVAWWLAHNVAQY